MEGIERIVRSENRHGGILNQFHKGIPLCLDKKTGIGHFLHHQIMPESDILKQQHIFRLFQQHLGVFSGQCPGFI